VTGQIHEFCKSCDGRKRTTALIIASYQQSSQMSSEIEVSIKIRYFRNVIPNHGPSLLVTILNLTHQKQTCTKGQ